MRGRGNQSLVSPIETRTQHTTWVSVISQIQQRFSLFQFVGSTTTASDAWLFLLLYVLSAILAAAAVLSLIYLANIICGCCPVRSRSLGHIDARSELDGSRWCQAEDGLT